MKSFALTVSLCLLLLNSLAPARPVARAHGPVPAGGFATCAQALAAGYAGMLLGDAAYRPRLDRDHDGVACEPRR